MKNNFPSQENEICQTFFFINLAICEFVPFFGDGENSRDPNSKVRLSDQPNNRGIKFGQGLHNLEIRATAVFQVGRLPRYIPTISHRIHLLVYGIFPDIYHGFPGTFLEKSIPFPRKTWRTSRSLPSTSPRWSSTLAVGIWSGILRVHKTLEGSCDLNRGGGDDLHTVEPGGTTELCILLKA